MMLLIWHLLNTRSEILLDIRSTESIWPFWGIYVHRTCPANNPADSSTESSPSHIITSRDLSLGDHKWMLGYFFPTVTINYQKSFANSHGGTELKIWGGILWYYTQEKLKTQNAQPLIVQVSVWQHQTRSTTIYIKASNTEWFSEFYGTYNLGICVINFLMAYNKFKAFSWSSRRNVYNCSLSYTGLHVPGPLQYVAANGISTVIHIMGNAIKRMQIQYLNSSHQV
jgi:hypothetical protein